MDWNRVSGDFRSFLLSSSRSPSTARSYCASLLIFWRWCARYEITPFDADRSLIRAWVAERTQCVSGVRISVDISALRWFYKWLRDDHYRDDDPVAGIGAKRTQKLPTEPLSVQEYEALLGACDNERDRLILMMLAFTALRIQELANLRAEDINWERGELKIVGKGDKQRPLAPMKEVINRLHAYLGMFPSGPLFISKYGNPLSEQQIRKIIYSVAEKAGLEHVHPHRFRAFYATEYMEQSGDIQALQAIEEFHARAAL